MLRSRILSVLALFFLSLQATAQVRSAGPTRAAAKNNAVSYGSYQRTKLLTQGRTRVTEDVRRLGAVDRRTLLTTGKSIYKKKPERRYHR